MRPALVGFALLGLLSLAAAGSAGDEWGGGLVDRDVPSAFVDYAFTLGVVYLVVFAAIWVWAITGPSTPGPKKERRQRRDLVTIALLLLAAVAYLAFAEPRVPEPAPEQPLAPGGATRTTPETTEAVPPDAAGPEFQWWVVLALLLALAAVAAYLRLTRSEPSQPDAAEELEAVLTEALDELGIDPDPRRAVIQAYVRMERVLSAHGHARKPHEAPLEYLARVLRELEVRPQAAHALTELFERARFSRHEIDAAMRDEALASLAAVRDDLRAAA